MENISDIQIRGQWLIDGFGSNAVKDPVINISGSMIDSITYGKQDTDQALDRIDYRECTIIPGLVDCHTHLAVTGSAVKDERDGQLDSPREMIWKRIEGHIRACLRYGIMAVRDAGDRGGFALEYKIRHIPDGLPVKIYAVGRAWHGKDRYGSFLGRAVDTNNRPSDFILENLDSGIDHIKIINSGIISLSRQVQKLTPHFSEEVLKMIVKKAHEKGLGVMVHANGPMPVEYAINAECDSIEHGFYMGDDNLKRMADKNIRWVPTLFTMKALEKMFPREGMEKKAALRALNDQILQAAKAAGYGVSIGIGTDSGSPGVCHGRSMMEEMKLLLSAGLSIEEVIRAGSNAGRVPSGDEEISFAIKTKGPATFTVVEGAPEKLPDSLDSIRAIWVKGKVIRTDQ